MAATIITISKNSDPSIHVEIKVNDGYSVPHQIVTDSITSFRTWHREDGHLFIWTEDTGHEVSIIVPYYAIGWIKSSMPIGEANSRFQIEHPCSVEIVEELPS